MTHWKRPWCWEGLRTGGAGDGKGWDGWMASPTQWTWVRINSRGWPGVLQFIGLQRARHDWATELTEQNEKRTLSQTVLTSTATLPSVQFSSVAQSCPTLCDPWTAVCKAFLVIISPQSLLKLMSIESVIPSNHLILCCPLLLPLWIFLSIRVFSNESALRIRWPKYWSFSFNISPSNEYLGLIFMMNLLDLLGVQGTVKSLLQHRSSKASIFQCSACFIDQLSHPYMTTGKIIALTRWTFVDKVMSLLLNMLSRLVKTFLPRSKRLLISWLQSPSAVILEPTKIKSATVFSFPIDLPWSDGRSLGDIVKAFYLCPKHIPYAWVHSWKLYCSQFKADTDKFIWLVMIWSEFGLRCGRLHHDLNDHTILPGTVCCNYNSFESPFSHMLRELN